MEPNVDSSLKHRIFGVGLALSRRWVWVITGAIVLTAIVVYRCFDTLDHAAQFGEYLSGFSAALAFLWLIAGFRLQSAEIAMQREELKLQRIAAENQAKELRNSARFASLSQIETLLQRANSQIQGSELGIKGPLEISTFWLNGTKQWKTMLETTDATTYTNLYSKWLKIESLSRQYIATLAHALKIYLEHNTEASLDLSLPDDQFIYIYSSWMNRAPYLSEHAGPAYMVANLIFLYGPGLEALQLGYLFATKQLLGEKIVKMDVLNERKAAAETAGLQLPAIIAATM